MSRGPGLREVGRLCGLLQAGCGPVGLCVQKLLREKSLSQCPNHKTRQYNRFVSFLYSNFSSMCQVSGLILTKSQILLFCFVSQTSIKCFHKDDFIKPQPRGEGLDIGLHHRVPGKAVPPLGNDVSILQVSSDPRLCVWAAGGHSRAAPTPRGHSHAQAAGWSWRVSLFTPRAKI